MNIKIKRVYEQPDKDDGRSILVERLWPRGLTKEKASVDPWLKEIAPSTELRKWFGSGIVQLSFEIDTKFSPVQGGVSWQTIH